MMRFTGRSRTGTSGNGSDDKDVSELLDAEDAPNPSLVRDKMTPAMILAAQGNDDALQELVTARRSIQDLTITTDVSYTNEDGVAALHRRPGLPYPRSGINP